MTTDQAHEIDDQSEGTSARAQRVGLILGLALFAALLVVPLPGLEPAGRKTLAVTALVAALWLSQAIPIPAASLLPLVLLPLLGAVSTKDVARLYVNENTFLFLGGFLLAIAIERCGLHRRLASSVIAAVGTSPRRLTFAFMALASFTSLWISNTATTLMLLPIALAVVAHLEADVDASSETEVRSLRNFATMTLLCIAFGASIGGLGTPIGTPPNALFLGHVSTAYPDRPELQLSFARWMLGMVPLVAVFAPVAWLGMSRVLPSPGLGRLFAASGARTHAPSGPMTRDQKIVGAIFVLTALLWIFRADVALGSVTLPGWASLLGVQAFVHDGTVAILAATALFFIPSESKGRLLDWSAEAKVPWGILLLFGAGFAIAGAFEQTGLDDWTAGHFARHLPVAALPATALTAGVVTLMSEFCNNTATAAVLLPVTSSMAAAGGLHPFTYALPAAIAASCGFMLPVATAPNAIAFATGRVRVGDMVRAGLILDVIGIGLVTLFAVTWWRVVLW